MKFIKLDPPGSFCSYAAVTEMIRQQGARTFIEIGCGSGDLSRKLCEMGLTGIGLDFSAEAIKLAEKNLEPFISQGKYRLIAGDILQLTAEIEPVDLGISMMVMEHVENDVQFLMKIASVVKSGGCVIAAVPARMDCWTFEDDTVGHLRRYERQNLDDTFKKAGLSNTEIWSVAVPTANLLLKLSDVMVRNSDEKQKLQASANYQTQMSGIREIPFKTVFPPFCKLILNRFTLLPLLVLQRFFYQTNLGLTLLAVGSVGLRTQQERSAQKPAATRS